MAWITKNSGTQVIERRETPWFDDDMKAYVAAELLPRYPDKRGALIPTLHVVQDKHNWLPWQALEEVAEFLELQPSEVADTATFYEEFFLEPRGKYTLWVCRSVSCEIMGGEKILAELSAKLGIAEGETTPDGKITLMPVECIGACGSAPCGLVNHCLVEDLSLNNIDEMIEKLDQIDPHAYTPPASYPCSNAGCGCDGRREGAGGDA